MPFNIIKIETNKIFDLNELSNYTDLIKISSQEDIYNLIKKSTLYKKHLTENPNELPKIYIEPIPGNPNYFIYFQINPKSNNYLTNRILQDKYLTDEDTYILKCENNNPINISDYDLETLTESLTKVHCIMIKDNGEYYAHKFNNNGDHIYSVTTLLGNFVYHEMEHDGKIYMIFCKVKDVSGNLNVKATRFFGNKYRIYDNVVVIGRHNGEEYFQMGDHYYVSCCENEIENIIEMRDNNVDIEKLPVLNDIVKAY